jgi:signal peptidase I
MLPPAMDSRPAPHRKPLGPPRAVLGPIPRYARWLAAAMVLVLALHACVAETFRVVGSSMEATLAPGDVLLVSKLRRGGPDRGDVVVFRFPTRPDAVLVKRVIGVPGDRVVIRAGSVAVSDPAHPGGRDPALDAGARLAGASTEGAFDGVVPAGALFVLGDNRRHGASSDSREWGWLPLEDVIGTSVLRLWPIGLDAAK